MASTAANSQQNDDSSLSIEQLMKKKLEFIENLEFEKASDIENQIQQRRYSTIESKYEEEASKLDQQIQNYYDILQNNLAIINENADQCELKQREIADSSFRETCERHMNELKQIQKEYSIEVLRAREKIVPQQLEQERRAKELAKVNDFEGAIRLRALAQKIHDLEHQQRREDINKKYESIKSQVYERQNNELAILSTKLKEALERKQRIVENDIQKQNKQFLVSVISEKQKSSTRLVNGIVNPEKKKAYAEKLDKYANSRVQEISGFVLNKAQSNSPNRTPKTSKQVTSIKSESASGLQEPDNYEEEVVEADNSNNDEEDFVDETGLTKDLMMLNEEEDNLQPETNESINFEEDQPEIEAQIPTEEEDTNQNLDQ